MSFIENIFLVKKKQSKFSNFDFNVTVGNKKMLYDCKGENSPSKLTFILACELYVKLPMSFGNFVYGLLSRYNIPHILMSFILESKT